MTLTLGFSPCPNDTFIFDALVNKKIDTGEFDFDVRLEDVQTLNRWAIAGELDVTKFSYGVLSLVMDSYVVLNSGSALGTGVGPLLISSRDIPLPEIENCVVAIPGEHTTAHMLFSLAFPEARNKVFLRYDEIEQFVSQPANARRAGVIIHENRFTYMDKGLVKILDLGKFWEDKTTFPIPLGGIVVKRNIDKAVAAKIDALIRQSIDFAFSNYPVISEYVKSHSQEMDVTVMRKHIELYVNRYSISLGAEGRKAIKRLLNVSPASNGTARPLFLENTI